MTLIFEIWLFLITKMNLIVQWEWECMWKMGVDSIYFIKIIQLILFFIIIYLIIKTTFILHNQKHFQENKNKNKIKIRKCFTNQNQLYLFSQFFKIFQDRQSFEFRKKVIGFLSHFFILFLNLSKSLIIFLAKSLFL